MNCSVRIRGLAAVWIALGLALRGATAQIPFPAGTDIFSGGPEPVPALAGFPHTLLLRHGGQLRGELVSLDEDFIVWRRPDAAEPLRFHRAEVRKILLGPPEKVEEISEPKEKAATRPIVATAKLAGADWLCGRLSSKEGESFSLQAAPQLEFALTRAQIEWLQFEHAPAPAFGFSGSLVDLDCRNGPVDPTPARMAGAVLVLPARNILQRMMAAQRRLEIDLAMNEKDAAGVRLELEGPAFAGGQENVAFRFTQGSVECNWARFEAERSETLRPAERRGQEAAVYRIFYDGPGAWLALWRNDRQLFNWRLNTRVMGLDGLAPPPHGTFSAEQTCVESVRVLRESGEKSGPLRLNHLAVRPWDGLLPGPRRAALQGDILTFGKQSPAAGKLESLSPESVTFSGAATPLAPGLLVEFQHTPELGFTPDARLLLGAAGELSAADLSIEGGNVTCKTSMAPSQRIPVAAVGAIALLDGGGPRGAGADFLVWKDGDELRGKLVSIDSGGPVHWRMPSGQDAVFENHMLAGIRLAVGKSTFGEAAQTLELRDGDRLTGTLEGFNAEKFHFGSAQFGEISGDRHDLWRVSRQPEAAPRDGGIDPAGWLRGAWEYNQANAEGEDALPMARNAWIEIDGRYALREGQQAPFVGGTAGLESPFAIKAQYFQITFEAAGRGALPAFIFAVEPPAEGGLRDAKSPPEGPALAADFTYPRLAIESALDREPQSIDVREKLKASDSHVLVSVYVNSQDGTADAFLDGLPVARLGRGKGEQLRGLGGRLLLSSPALHELGTVFSKIWIGPWNGQLPHAGPEEGHALFSNGDSTAGAPKEIREGKLSLETDIGPLELPIKRVQTIEFGGVKDPRPSVGRLRLLDGSVVNVDRFHYEVDGFSIHSPALGDLKVPGSAVSELIVDPALLQASEAMKGAVDP